MFNLKATIVPFEGVGDLKLYATYEETVKVLQASETYFQEENWEDYTGESGEPLKIIVVPDYMMLYFTKGKLYKISALHDYQGKLPNDVCVGMDLEKAQGLDDGLKFDEKDQMYTSTLGYIVEDNLDRHCIESIIIFIKELNTPDFKAGNW